MPKLKNSKETFWVNFKHFLRLLNPEKSIWQRKFFKCDICVIFKQCDSDCRPLATTEDDKTAICQALDNLIDECTLILGWCYSQDHVRTTKVQQRDLSRSALAKMQIYCPDNKNSLHLPEDKFAEKAQLASLPLKPTMIFETSSSAKLVYSTMAFGFSQFLIQFFLWNWNINEWLCYVVFWFSHFYLNFILVFFARFCGNFCGNFYSFILFGISMSATCTRKMNRQQKQFQEKRTN